jgi:hypothetical protein
MVKIYDNLDSIFARYFDRWWNWRGRAQNEFLFALPATRLSECIRSWVIETRTNTVLQQSQVGESLSTGVELTSVYAARKAKVEKSISIIEVRSGRTAPHGSGLHHQ